eukprot:jgi/Botrbrau1/14342/Bobra.0222s0012.1
MWWLNLNELNLTGTLPSSRGGMRDVKYLMLYNNSLSGTLPSAWSGLVNMTKVGLAINHLSGTLPESWGNMSKMEWVWLSDNRFSGTLPSNWSQMRNLQNLFLYNNSLTGTLPTSWTDLSHLQLLYLSNNSLEGTLPSSWSNFSHLQKLGLSMNKLSGTVPASWGSIVSLQELSLGSNLLQGSMPQFIFNNSNLTFVTLDHNNLTGSFPAIAHLPEVMDVSNNSLTGELPKSLKDSVLVLLSNNSFKVEPNQLPDYDPTENLRVFSIGGNQNLQGSVPTGWYNRTVFKNVSVLDVGGLLHHDAKTKLWRERYCTNYDLFEGNYSTKEIVDGISKLRPALLAGITLETGDRPSPDSKLVLRLTDVGPILERVPTNTVPMVQDLCKNDGWQAVVAGMWGSLLALMVLAYIFRKPLARKWHKYIINVGPWTPLADVTSAIFVSLYWYDFYTDILTLNFLYGNTGNRRWSFYVLLILFLSSFVAAAVLMSLNNFRMARAQLGNFNAILPRKRSRVVAEIVCTFLLLDRLGVQHSVSQYSGSQYIHYIVYVVFFGGPVGSKA